MRRWGGWCEFKALEVDTEEIDNPERKKERKEKGGKKDRMADKTETTYF